VCEWVSPDRIPPNAYPPSMTAATAARIKFPLRITPLSLV
jgi:hypothetical protein